jgi:hypothetical protein
MSPTWNENRGAKFKANQQNLKQTSTKHGRKAVDKLNTEEAI